jgi:hypothetical protein
MYLTALTHRDPLFDIARRWLAGHPRPEDGRGITEIFTFDRIITGPSVRAMVADLAHGAGHGALRLERVLTKDAVREAIAEAADGSSSPRVRSLIERYRICPEEFFPRTPVYMSLVTADSGALVSLVRRKRTRRIADKVSRRLANRLAGAIQEVATSLAARRAERAGVPVGQLVSTREEMEEDFAEAERIVARRIQTQEISLDANVQRVDDVIGVKIIGTPAELERIEQILLERPMTSIHHREVHNGAYCGTHVVVEIELPPVCEIIDSMRDSDWRFAAHRGVPPKQLAQDFPHYVERGARTFCVELILTTFEDLVESEFGRSIHEVRVLEQRDRTSYSGRIAQNASYIIEYLLRLAVSPTTTVSELPFTIGGRYLRDTVSQAITRLSGEEPMEWLTAPITEGGSIRIL